MSMPQMPPNEALLARQPASRARFAISSEVSPHCAAQARLVALAGHIPLQRGADDANLSANMAAAPGSDWERFPSLPRSIPNSYSSSSLALGCGIIDTISPAVFPAGSGFAGHNGSMGEEPELFVEALLVRASRVSSSASFSSSSYSSASNSAGRSSTSTASTPTSTPSAAHYEQNAAKQFRRNMQASQQHFRQLSLPARSSFSSQSLNNGGERDSDAMGSRMWLWDQEQGGGADGSSNGNGSGNNGNSGFLTSEDRQLQGGMLRFAAHVSDLPLDAHILFLICAPGAPADRASSRVVGCACLPLFSKKRTLKMGMQRLDVMIVPRSDSGHVHAMDSDRASTSAGEQEWVRLHAQCCPSLITTARCENALPPDVAALIKRVKRYHRGELGPSIPWLDLLSLRESQAIIQRSLADVRGMHLWVELPNMNLPVLFAEQESAVPFADAALLQVSARRRVPTVGDQWSVWDPEVYRDTSSTAQSAGAGQSSAAPLDPSGVYALDPITFKHVRLVSSYRRKLIDPNLRPTKEERDRLEDIVYHYSLTQQQHLSVADKDLLWKFRYYLSKNKRALTKFLRCVDWLNQGEATQAKQLMDQWAAPDISDALELLSHTHAHTPASSFVRDFAVKQLKSASNADLCSYLLQLVQALRYDTNVLRGGKTTGDQGLSVEESDSSSRDSSVGTDSKLSRFLIARSVQDVSVRNYLYWFLRVECEDPVYGAFYQKQLARFMTAMHKYFQAYQQRALGEGSSIEASRLSGVTEILHQFKRQEDINAILVRIYDELRKMKGNLAKKTQRFMEMLSPGGTYYSTLGHLPDNETVILSCRPTFHIRGVVTDRCRIFSSSLEPIRVTFWGYDMSSPLSSTKSSASPSTPTKMFASRKMTDDPKHADQFTVIFKSGDDMRQDQVVLQLIALMDLILRRENLDLKLTPYGCLATGATQGVVEFVNNSAAVTEILGSGNIHAYFKKHHPDPSAKYGIDSTVIHNFVRSCAGYCVITYILCVGDRHFDNVLITQDGKMFHIDFGFIGRDPKPYPPPMKLSSEMVAAMGGEGSAEFTLFRQLCVEAYNVLRKNSSLFLNLLQLMADSNIEDIGHERNILQVQERFQLEKSDEEAGQSFQKLMQESIAALFPRIAEKIHKWKQYWDQR